jgi:RNA polymerase sigma-70 factor (ECF subfamily)
VALTELDRNLLNRCLEHDPGAWNDFVDRFLGLIHHVVHHASHSRSVPMRPEDVEDVCAEILLQIVAHDYGVLRRFRGKSSLATYITVIARRVCVRELLRRHFDAELGHTVAHVAVKPNVDITSAPEERIENEDEVRVMLEGLARKEATVVRMFHMEGRTYQEISDATGISENSIGPTLKRAREKLRRRVEQRTPA